MDIKNDTEPKKIFLSLEDTQRLVKFFEILIKVDQRLIRSGVTNNDKNGKTILRDHKNGLKTILRSTIKPGSQNESEKEKSS